MEDKLAEFLAFMEEDAKCWDDAAERCEEFAQGLPEAKKAEYRLLGAVYRERAQLHRKMLAKFHPS